MKGRQVVRVSGRGECATVGTADSTQASDTRRRLALSVDCRVECGTDGGPNHVGAAEDAVVRRILSRRAATFAAARGFSGGASIGSAFANEKSILS
jgi:hypothetical protein